MGFHIDKLVSLLCIFTLLQTSDAFWGGGGNGGYGGGMGGFHSGYGHQGNGYGQGICAGARQRQQGFGGGGFPQQQQQPVSPYSYNNDYGGGYNNGYYQNPAPVYQRPIQNSNLDYRINLPLPQPTAAPAPTTCSLPSARDPVVFDQKCIFPRESVQSSCSSRGNTVPIGTASVTSCKSPQYRSDTGDIILEVCKDGMWHSDGKTLTCKSTAIATPPVVDVVPNPPRNSVAQYVQNPQPVSQPRTPTNNIIPSNPDPIPVYNPQSQQPYWSYNQPAPPSTQQVIVPTQEPVRYTNPQYNPQQYWNYNQTNTPVSSDYPVQYPPYIPPSSTTTSTTTTTTEAPSTTTTTTTYRPYKQVLENIDWRQYTSSDTPSHASNHYYNNPATSSDINPIYSQSGEKCPPLSSKAGMILECISKKPQNNVNGGSGYTVSVSDCQDTQPVGAEATYKCQMYYEPLSGMPTQYRKCKENGMWTGNDEEFGCKLECGMSNPAGRLPLITFGETTILGQWPWHAALFIRDRGDVTNACGGTLVSRRGIVTAAHCVNLYLSSLTRDLNDIRVDLGRFHRTKDDPYVQKIQIEKIITHPAYNPFIFESDIAIIILKDSARIGFHVRPVCFPKSQNVAFNEMQLEEGSFATVVGWGVDETGGNPDELKAAKIQVIGYRECIESFEEADTGSLLAKSTTFCATNKNGTNVCRGDSGSGAFFAVKTSTGSTRWYLQGLVSLGINVSGEDKKCDPEKVSIFTRVSPYADWINRVLSENDAM